MTQEKVTRCFSGFNTEEEAEEWLDNCTEWFVTSYPDWEDWTVTTLIGGIPTPGKIRATFEAEYID